MRLFTVNNKWRRFNFMLSFKFCCFGLLLFLFGVLGDNKKTHYLERKFTC